MFPTFLESLRESDHEQVVVVRDSKVGLLAVIALHSTAAGPAFGGVRRFAYRRQSDALRDVLRLSTAMTYKCLLAGVPGGGGKIVMLDHSEMDRPEAYRLLGRYVQNMAGRMFTGPDVGTGDEELRYLQESTDYVTVPGPDGPGDLAAATARGVIAGLRAVVAILRGASGVAGDLEGTTFAVQGLGGVGFKLAQAILAQGGRVLAADEKRETLQRATDELGVEPVDSAEVLDAECDVLVPCALGGILHDLTIERLRCRAIAGSANNVLVAPEHAHALAERGILVAPDYVINSGALILGANFHLTGERDQAAAIDRIGEELFTLLQRAEAEGIPPPELADRIAKERLQAVRGDRYYFPGERT